MRISIIGLRPSEYHQICMVCGGAVSIYKDYGNKAFVNFCLIFGLNATLKNIRKVMDFSATALRKICIFDISLPLFVSICGDVLAI